MARVKNAVTKLKRKRALLKRAKGFRFGRSTKVRQAKEALYHAGNHAFRDRKNKKRNFRSLFTVRINAGVRSLGMSYSTFIDRLKKSAVTLDRKVLSELANNSPETFSDIVSFVKKASPLEEKKVVDKTLQK